MQRTRDACGEWAREGYVCDDNGVSKVEITDFLGIWKITREIVEQSGETHHLTGRAEFSQAADGVTYHEEGQLVTATGAQFTANRVYHWRDTGNGRVQVLFDDGRDFHNFDLTSDDLTDQHWCDPDMYHVSYNLADWPVWSSVWTVTGPRKDYRMITRYRRSGV
ncbi:DUF6314 family protein [Aliiroseovarius sp. S1123]|uniref:DUF6314 family protein n=1 Tax=unclassified Aliiroseovarius TaxID=2623558 RepID=UPI001FF62E5E|nr:DUF6314 family protein [Aliiroseovarius sp. S1123]MCK0169707.1 DUF6314 family protein [Aliiroseovarius sp. S1123]